MDVSGTSSSTSLYAYQSAVAANGQTSAVFQALTSAYNSSASSDGTDPLTALVGEANNSSLVSAIYTQGQALQSGGTGGSTSGIQGLAPSQIVGGLDASAASSLLQGLSTDSSSGNGLQGFDAAIGGAVTLATTASQAQQAYGNGTLTSEAQTQAKADQNAAASTTTTTGDTVTSTSGATGVPAYVQQATAAAQLAALNNTFSLLA